MTSKAVDGVVLAGCGDACGGGAGGEFGISAICFEFGLGDWLLLGGSCWGGALGGAGRLDIGHKRDVLLKKK